MAESYTIAIVPLDTWGHINPCLGIAQTLTRMAHNCVFVVNQQWEEVIRKNGFECRVYQKPSAHDSSSDHWTQAIAGWGENFKLSPLDQIRAAGGDYYSDLIGDIKSCHQSISDILLELKPDGIIMDTIIVYPAVQLAGIPWILYMAANPLFLGRDERLPPSGSGLATNGDKRLWNEFYAEEVAVGGETWREFNEWLSSVGAPQLHHSCKYLDPSPYLNIICYAKELSYEDIAPKEPNKYVYVDNFLRDVESNDLVEYREFEIPDQMRNKPGKLVYLSMGSLACAYLELMRRLVAILSKSMHRFIVSKGPFGDQLELPDNMWGQKSLPQLQVLRVVDAVITHGGNNTVAECLSAGTPMIVMPMFMDQFDNAQRVQEKGLGLRMDAFRCTESEVLSAVDCIVNDQGLKVKYNAISERIRRDNSKQRAAEMIVKVIERSDENN